MKILELSGSAYEIGFQHGKELKSLIETAIEKRRIALERKQKVSSKELNERAEEIKKHFPELIEEIEGISGGSSLSFEEILSHNFGELPESCSNIAFLGNNEPILGHVNDDVSKGEFDVAFHIETTAGREIKYIGTAGSVGICAAVNSDGLATSHACARSAGLKSTGAVLNLRLFRRDLIQRCKSGAEAEAFVKKQSFTSGADNIICVDKTGSAFIAEKLPGDVAFRYPAMDALYCTGRALTPQIKKLTGQDDYELGNAIVEEIKKRERFFETSISTHNSDFSVEKMKSILLEEGAGIWNEWSNWAAILLPEKFEMIFTTELEQNWQII